MKETWKNGWVASVLGLGTLLAGPVFGILIPFILWVNWLALTEPPGGGTLGEGILMVPVALIGVLAGLSVGLQSWLVLWENRARDVRWRIHRTLARAMAVCVAIVVAGCAEAVGVRPEIPVLYRILLVGGIVVGAYKMVAVAFRWSGGRQEG